MPRIIEYYEKEDGEFSGEVTLPDIPLKKLQDLFNAGKMTRCMTVFLLVRKKLTFLSCTLNWNSFSMSSIIILQRAYSWLCFYFFSFQREKLYRENLTEIGAVSRILITRPKLQ